MKKGKLNATLGRPNAVVWFENVRTNTRKKVTFTTPLKLSALQKILLGSFNIDINSDDVNFVSQKAKNRYTPTQFIKEKPYIIEKVFRVKVMVGESEIPLITFSAPIEDKKAFLSVGKLKDIVPLGTRAFEEDIPKECDNSPASLSNILAPASINRINHPVVLAKISHEKRDSLSSDSPMTKSPGSRAYTATEGKESITSTRTPCFVDSGDQRTRYPSRLNSLEEVSKEASNPNNIVSFCGSRYNSETDDKKVGSFILQWNPNFRQEIDTCFLVYHWSAKALLDISNAINSIDSIPVFFEILGNDATTPWVILYKKGVPIRVSTFPESEIELRDLLKNTSIVDMKEDIQMWIQSYPLDFQDILKRHLQAGRIDLADLPILIILFDQSRPILEYNFNLIQRGIFDERLHGQRLKSIIQGNLKGLLNPLNSLSSGNFNSQVKRINKKLAN